LFEGGDARPVNLGNPHEMTLVEFADVVRRVVGKGGRVLQAFGQVADSLTALEQDAEAVATSHEALDIAGASLALQRLSFSAGKTSALQLIVAENTYSNVSLGYVRAQSQQLTDTAQLLIAVGGGWWNGADLR